ncbi:hypothetical protein BHM03_00011730 [Ensete ventricosum]|nr:hypothetical protein BHM03_00011730 [Ensete ventricosum]
MSKKKSSFSGSTTMTLKDFHGGSIPSQLPLPSAPGSSAPLDRPAAWGTTAAAASGRSDHHHHLLRPRPGSAGATSVSARGLDERPSALLPHPPHIGRHFDEDERKPFDASSAPRRTPVAPDNALRSPPPSRSDPKRPISSPVSTLPAAVSSLPSPSGNIGSAAWGMRKEVGSEPLPSLPAQPTATMWSASKLAQASAVEKVSSGRWQLRTPEVEIIRSQETENLDRRFEETGRIVDGIDRDRERERPRSVSSVVAYADVKERTIQGSYTDRAWDQERVRSPIHPEMKERNVAGFSYEGTRPASSDGRFGGSKVYQQGGVEVSERPKLNLLPRKKPQESPDIQAREFDDKQIEASATIQPGERAERLPVEQRTGKDLERKGHQPDSEKVDLQKASWRNDNRKNTRGNEKPLEQPRADTDTWRKPVEQPKPDIPAPRFGKAASAVELAQAFSRSVSDARPENRFASQRSISGQPLRPFSRLTDTREVYSGPSQRQINGY